MPLFVCAKCACIDNTATGFWWTRVIMKEEMIWNADNKDFKGMGLCCECAPTHFIDGGKTGYGKWYNHFEKEHYSKVNYQAELMQLP